MHGFIGDGKLGLCTGMTFGDNYSPSNFEPVAVLRNQHAKYLWSNEATKTLAACSHYIEKLKIDPATDDERPFGKANKDSLNPGVLNADGSRQPPEYAAHVDDNIYADVEEFLPLTIAASVTALEDVFGGNHPNQEPVLSDEKLHLFYQEFRTLLGHEPDSRSMKVRISRRRREKILAFIREEGWLEKHKKATIKEIAQLLGMLQSACEFFDWGMAQLLVMQDLLRGCIQRGFNLAQQNKRIHKTVDDAHRDMPKNYHYRLQYLAISSQCRYMWNSKSLVTISDQVQRSINDIYIYLFKDLPWEKPIGHIVPRDPSCVSWGDASHNAIGVVIPDLKIVILLPYSEHLYRRIKKGEVHINVLEFLALFLAYLAFLKRYNLDPSQFPPFPTMLSWGDSKSANKWMRTISTASVMGQNALRLFANYTLQSPVTSFPEHIAGKDNIEADDVSRPDELFSPKKSHIYDIPYPILMQQVCRKYNKLRSWTSFHPSAEILSDLNYVLSSVSRMEVPKRRQNLGHFCPVESIFSGSASNTTSSIGSFL
jgi:hypothetical protein